MEFVEHSVLLKDRQKSFESSVLSSFCIRLFQLALLMGLYYWCSWCLRCNNLSCLGIGGRKCLCYSEVCCIIVVFVCLHVLVLPTK